MPLTRLLRCCAFAGLMGLAAVASAGVTLRIVPHADLRVLDPLWTTAAITRNHGYAVYDTLFGIDAEGVVRPQMVERYEVEAAGRIWRFTLREGLAFHDGRAVSAADVVASIRRWGQFDVLGRPLVAALAGLEAVDQRTFVLRFQRPFGLVLEALSKPSANPLFIMPREVAETPADRRITSTIGSGPYIFATDEYRPGEKAVYLRNPRYVPRAEAPSGTAGGKVVHVDRMEWLVIADPQTQVNALINGEVDLLEWVPAEQYARLRRDPRMELFHGGAAGSFALHLNLLVPPFNDRRIARAALLAVNQEALLRAQLVEHELYGTNPSIYPSTSPFAVETPGFSGRPQPEQARALLKEAGYAGEPVVLLEPSNFALLDRLPTVMAALLRRAGFTVRVETMDWATLVARRAVRKPPGQGGWNAFVTGWLMADNANPLFFPPVSGLGEQGWYGWNADDGLEALKRQFAEEPDPGRRKELAARIQQRVLEDGVLAPLGEFKLMAAFRKGRVSGLITAPVNVLWGASKS